MEDHSDTTISAVTIQKSPGRKPDDSTAQSQLAGHAVTGQHATEVGAFTDEEVLPAIEAGFDLPLSPVRDTVDAKHEPVAEKGEPLP